MNENDTCATCIYRVLEEIVEPGRGGQAGLYEPVCRMNTEPEWDYREECWVCDEYERRDEWEE